MVDQQIIISVQNANVLEFDSDVLAVKHAQALYGVDHALANRLTKDILAFKQTLPTPEAHKIIDTSGSVAPSKVLVVGVKNQWGFDYAEIRRFARRTLEILNELRLRVEHLSLTVHGPGFGL